MRTRNLSLEPYLNRLPGGAFQERDDCTQKHAAGPTGDHVHALSFRLHAGLTMVYIGAVPEVEWTRLGTAISALQSDAVARECLSFLHRTQQCMNDLTPCLTAPAEQIREAFERLMHLRYGVKVNRVANSPAQLVCGPKSVPNTVATMLARSRLTFKYAVTLGIRADDPLESFLGPNRAQLRQIAKFMSLGLDVPKQLRTSSGYYQVIGDRVVPRSVLNNPHLPDQLRAAARQANWPLRDLVILELMICTGCRVAEACRLLWSGLPIGHRDEGIRLHNKGQQLVPRKNALLSQEAETMLMRYLTEVRPKHDKYNEAFKTWNRGRSWTLSRYAQFLKKEGIDPLTLPVFLTDEGDAYTPKTFGRQAWTRMKRSTGGPGSGPDDPMAGRLVVSAHHIRHWYINLELKKIEEDPASAFGTPSYLRALFAFVKRMGWSSWHSMIPYDHVGVATEILCAGSRGGRSTYVTHSGMDELVELASDDPLFVQDDEIDDEFA